MSRERTQNLHHSLRRYPHLDYSGESPASQIDPSNLGFESLLTRQICPWREQLEAALGLFVYGALSHGLTEMVPTVR